MSEGRSEGRREGGREGGKQWNTAMSRLCIKIPSLVPAPSSQHRVQRSSITTMASYTYTYMYMYMPRTLNVMVSNPT